MEQKVGNTLTESQNLDTFTSNLQEGRISSVHPLKSDKAVAEVKSKNHMRNVECP